MTVTQEPRRTQGLSWTADGRVVPPARQRLVPLVADSNRLVGWVAALAVTAVAAFLRYWKLGSPHSFLFDETYYAKNAWSLLHHGYAREYVKDIDPKILDGQLTGLLKDNPDMTVHPEVGKWLIALGEQTFGMDPLGWRVASALAGALMVLVVIRLVRRLTGSTLLGCTAGVLLCFDGLQFVMSRLALLDIFLALFILCGVACLVADRDWTRARVLQLTADGGTGGLDRWIPPRRLRWRPWRLAAGVMFGLAIGVKWAGIWPLAVFGVWVVFQDAGVRRMLGVRHAWLKAAIADGFLAFGYLVVVAFLVYVATWTGWLFNAHEYDVHLSNTQYGTYWGDWTKHDPKGFWDSLTQGLRSLYHYHLTVFDFHSNGLEESTHIYQSNPGGWPLINRPVGVEALTDIQPGEQGCAAVAGSNCLRQIVLLGTPVLWWGGALALLYSCYAWLARRDWRYGVAVLGFASTWLTWLPFAGRPIFYFYAVTMVPFTVIACTLLMGHLVGGTRASYTRRAWGSAIAGAFVVLVVANFAWFYPIYTGDLLTNAEWLDRVWFKRWI